MSPGGFAAAAQMRRPAARNPPAPLLTLEAAQNIAVANHPDIKVRQFDVLVAREAVNVAKSGYSPQVYGDAVTALAPPGTRISAYGGLNDPTVIQRTGAGLGAAQYITDFGRTANNVRAAEYQLKAQAAATYATRDSVLLNVTAAYFEGLRANALTVVADQTQRERRTLLTQVRVLQRAGLRSTLDVAIAARDLSQADQLVLQARNERNDAFASLAVAMGTSQQRTYSLRDIQRLPAPPPNLSNLLDTANRENPRLSSLQAGLSAAQSRILATGKLGLPTVYAYGYLGATPFHARNQLINSSYEAVGLSLNIPIFDGGAFAAERRAAQNEAYAAAESVESERNQLAHDVHVAYDGVETARGNITVTDRFLSTARQTFDLTSTRYRIGLSSIVDVSAAQLSETQAAIARTNATYDYIVQEAALEFATGIIGSADVLTGGRPSRGIPDPTAMPTGAPPTPPPKKRHRRFF